jgi:hypothetical protein
MIFCFPSHIKTFVEFPVSKFELEVDVGINHSLLVFRSIHIIGLYRFVQVVDFEVFGEVLINEQSTSTAPLSMRVSMICLLKPILIRTEIEFQEMLAIVTE